jgi:hypothetical protein
MADILSGTIGAAIGAAIGVAIGAAAILGNVSIQ